MPKANFCILTCLLDLLAWLFAQTFLRAIDSTRKINCESFPSPLTRKTSGINWDEGSKRSKLAAGCTGASLNWPQLFNKKGIFCPVRQKGTFFKKLPDWRTVVLRPEKFNLRPEGIFWGRKFFLYPFSTSRTSECVAFLCPQLSSSEQILRLCPIALLMLMLPVDFWSSGPV